MTTNSSYIMTKAAVIFLFIVCTIFLITTSAMTDIITQQVNTNFDRTDLPVVKNLDLVISQWNEFDISETKVYRDYYVRDPFDTMSLAALRISADLYD